MEELKENSNQKDRNYRDGELCLQVCRAIDRGIVYGKDIYDVIQYEDGRYGNFRSALSKIKNRGYIKFSSNQKVKNPFKDRKSYALTVKGIKFIQNPDERWQRKQAKIHSQVLNILKNQPEFLSELAKNQASQPQSKVVEYVNTTLGTNFGVNDIGQVEELIESMKGNQDNENKSNHKINQNYYAAMNRVKELENEVTALKNSRNGTRSNCPNSKIQNTKEESQLQIYRRKIAKQAYSGRLQINHDFFHAWQNIRPAKVKGRKWFTKNSVEFISKSNREYKRGHAIEMTPEQIFSSQFYILKIEQNGIRVKGKGVVDSGELLLF